MHALTTLNTSAVESRGSFTLEQLNKMIDDTRAGRTFYNTLGQPATTGQTTLTLEQLLRFKDGLEGRVVLKQIALFPNKLRLKNAIMISSNFMVLIC